jgi:hypothetical protein
MAAAGRPGDASPFAKPCRKISNLTARDAIQLAARRGPDVPPPDSYRARHLMARGARSVAHASSRGLAGGQRAAGAGRFVAGPRPGPGRQCLHQSRQPGDTCARAESGLHSPVRKNRTPARTSKLPKNGRPPAFDRDLHRLRQAVENSIYRLKRHHGAATRYDRLAAASKPS